MTGSEYGQRRRSYCAGCKGKDVVILKQKLVYRWICYLIGLVVLALGLSLNTKAGLGVSPIISVSYCVSQLLHNSFADMTMLLYSGFIVIEMVLHLAKRKGTAVLVQDLLQLPLSLVFTRFMNIFVLCIPDFATAYAGRLLGSLPFRIVVLLLAIGLTGIGAAMSLNMRIIANPGDGIVQAIADYTGKSVGLMKNCVDASCIALALVIGFAAAHSVVGVGLGTILAMIGTGRVIAIFNYWCMQNMLRKAGLPTR